MAYRGSLHWIATAATNNDGTNYTKCAGTTAGADCFGFYHAANNRLEYTAAEGSHVKVLCTFSATCTGATEAEFKLYKNGVAIHDLGIQRTIGTGSPAGAGCVSASISMKAGDYIELWCKTDNAADDITIEAGELSVWSV